MSCRDLLGRRTVAPGDGTPVQLPVDRNGNVYPNDVYFYDSNNTRQQLSSTVASLALTGCLPLVIKPLAVTSRVFPSPPWATDTVQSYKGSENESIQFSSIANITGAPGSVTYTIKRVTGPVKINMNCKLENWLSNGGGVYPLGVRLRLQHTNASSIVTTLYMRYAPEVDNDVYWTDDPVRAGSSNLSATFTGLDTLSVIVEGAGNTGNVKVNLYGITIY